MNMMLEYFKNSYIYIIYIYLKTKVQHLLLLLSCQATLALHFSPLQSIQVSSVQFSLLRSILVHFYPVWSILVHFSLLMSSSVSFGPFQSNLDYFSLVLSTLVHLIYFAPVLYALVQFCPFWSSSVQLGPFGLLQSNSLHFGLVWSIQTISVP